MSDVRLIHGDASRALQRLSAGSVRLFLVDPPYRTLDRSGAYNYQAGIGYRQLSWSTISTQLAIARRKLSLSLAR